MRIDLVTRSLSYGGAERQLVALARGLHAKGHRVRVLVFYPRGPLQRELEEGGVPVTCLGKRHRWDLAGFLWRAFGCIRRGAPDVVHGYLVAPNLMTVPLRLWPHRPRIVWGIRASNMDLERYDWLARLSFQASRALSRAADLIVVNSEAGLRFHREAGFAAGSMVCIPNGIDTGRFRPDPAQGLAVRASWGIPPFPEATVVGHVGRLDPMKDHPTLLAAAAEYRRRRPDVRFVCVGQGPEPYRAWLAEQTRRRGLEDHVRWVGSRDDMPAVLNAFDLFTSTSAFGEGFSNVIGEAMACGRLCVVTDVGDAARIVGDLGFIVPPGDAVRLVDAWDAALGALASRSAEAIRDRIERCFSVEALVDQTERELERLLDRAA